MKNLSIIYVALCILILSSCQKEADSVNPNYGYSTNEKTDSTRMGGKPNCGCNGQGNQNQMPPPPEQVIADLDTNDDQQISREEAKGPLAEDFDRIDKNQDGFVTVEELKQGGCPPPPADNSTGSEQNS